MLVLTRRPDEAIIVGDDVEIRVLAIEGDHVKLGVTAPRRIPVHRAEVYAAIQEANRGAAAAGVPDANALQALLKRRPPPQPD